jgi:hypothetical protein
MLNGVSVPVIDVRKVVKGNVNIICIAYAMQLDYRRQEPVLTGDNLKRGNPVVINLVSLCQRLYWQQYCYEKDVNYFIHFFFI